MSEMLMTLAKSSPETWAKKAGIPKSQGTGAYLRALQEALEQWLEDGETDPSAQRRQIQALLKVQGLGRLAGIAGAMRCECAVGDWGAVPDLLEAWDWLWGNARGRELPGEILWRSALSRHDVVRARGKAALLGSDSGGHAASALARALFGNADMTAEALSEWAALEPLLQLEIWGLAPPGVREAVKQMALPSLPVWLSLMVSVPAKNSRSAKALLAARVEVQHLALRYALDSVRPSLWTALLSARKEPKGLESLLAWEAVSWMDASQLSSVEAALLPVLRENAKMFARLAPILAAWPAEKVKWLRVRIEASLAGSEKAQCPQTLASWHELGLGQMSPAFGQDLFKHCRSPQEQMHFNRRWMKWYQECPQEALDHADLLFWDGSLPDMLGPAVLRVLARQSEARVAEYLPAFLNRYPDTALQIADAGDGLPQATIMAHWPLLLAALEKTEDKLRILADRLVTEAIRTGILTPAQAAIEKLNGVYRRNRAAFALEWQSFHDELMALSDLLKGAKWEESAKKPTGTMRSLLDEMCGLIACVWPQRESLSEMEPWQESAG